MRNKTIAFLSVTMLVHFGYAVSTERDPKAATPVQAVVPEVERAVVTHGTVTIGGTKIAYQAHAGFIVIGDDQGKPTAKMFYVAYLADRGDKSQGRPVTFVSNGGPGSSSAFLHMGIGPVYVRTPLHAIQQPAPFMMEPNDASLLDKTDLIFIDAVGTGFSEAIEPAQGTDFWGIDEDIDSFERAIKRWLTLHARWNSPKFLLGESYGGTRATGISHLLQQHGVQLNGVILANAMSSITSRDPFYDQFYITCLPTMAATAWYHNRLAERPPDLQGFLVEVREFARGPYLTALAKGRDLAPEQRNAIATQLARYTGLTAEYFVANSLRLDFWRFCKELLRAKSRTIGAIDTRVTGIDADAVGEYPADDVSMDALSGPYTAAVNDYLANTLQYHSDSPYQFYRGELIQSHWNWHRKTQGGYFPWVSRNLTLDLGSAMRENPHLKVIALLSYFDFAQPFYSMEYDLAHMPLDPSLSGNLTFAYFEAGHVIYADPDMRMKMKRDLDRFYDTAADHRRP